MNHRSPLAADWWGLLLLFFPLNIADIREATAEERLEKRQLKTKPLLKSMENWLRETMKTLSRHAELAKAFAYALNQWSALKYYAEDGWAEADNNIAENALRMVSLGRKNWLFFGSDHGGERGAQLYSLIGTCKLNGVEPERYLHHAFDIIADWPINRGQRAAAVAHHTTCGITLFANTVLVVRLYDFPCQTGTSNFDYFLV